eukprot:865635-Pleurochrysis_carterae.AAC.1
MAIIRSSSLFSDCSSCVTRARWQKRTAEKTSQSVNKEKAGASSGRVHGQGGALPWLMTCRPIVRKNKDLACYS